MRYRRASDALWRRLPDRVLLLTTAPGGVITLSHSGAVLWDVLDEERSLHELGELLGATFAVPPAQVITDIRTVLDDLVARGLVELGGAP